ncbi:MAG: hypothetical protein Q9216_000159 [Gyalolechia sp. 2 TL-2023]
MPRVTRATVRSQASSENSGVGTALSPPQTPPITKRTPLGEISGNQEEILTVVEDPEGAPIANKGKKGKKRKNWKKAKKNNEATGSKESENVLPDDNESELSSAVEDACQELLKEQAQDTSSIVMPDQIPHSPPSPAVIATTEELSQQPSQNLGYPGMVAQRDQINPEHNITEDQETKTVRDKVLKSPEGPKQVPNEKQVLNERLVEQSDEQQLQDEHRSPIQVAMRPEDSIEAMDKFEDEMEKVGDLIPATNGNDQNPKGTRRRGKMTAAAKLRPSSKDSIAAKLRKSSASRKTSLDINPKAAALLEKGAAVHPSTLAEPDVAKSGPTTRQVSDGSSASEKASTAAKKRISSVHKAPFVPAKSTKPPTRSNFELPGEAVARKLREAREERTKRDEEEEQKKPAFKARPVRLSTAPVVKPTATSRARISMARGEIPAPSAAKEATLKRKMTPRPSAVAAASTGTWLSTLSGNKRSTPAPANSSARVTRGPTSNSAGSKAVTAKSATQSTVRQSISNADAVQLKAKGKEVFNRGKVEQDERERMRKDKEEAAKKARAEAAERGRIASREWAEKQKAKRMAEKKANVVAETGTNGEAPGSAA